MTEALSIKRGMYVIVKQYPCRVVDVKRSACSKYPTTKIHITGVDVLTGIKYNETYKPHIMIKTFEINTQECSVINITQEHIQVIANDTITTFKIEDTNEVHQDLIKRFDPLKEIDVTIITVHLDKGIKSALTFWTFSETNCLLLKY